MTSRLLGLRDVAELSGTSENTLRYWRQRKLGPPSAKLGRRSVYRESDVLAWIEAQFEASAQRVRLGAAACSRSS